MTTVDQPAFTFHRCLGAGGFGEVYLASQYTQGGISRLVAVKVLKDDFDEGSDAVKRLRDEGQILAMLAHPAILGVHELTHIDGRLALVAEYVEGVDLAACCEKATLLPARVALGVVGEVAAALDWAWRTPHPHTNRPLHLIHRDIKPENIRLSRHGQVKVLDFGIARSTEMSRFAATRMGDVLMTPGYGAPEALAAGSTGPQVDVYALGATLYRLVLGEEFFSGKPIDYQVSLALDTIDYEEHLNERLQHIDDEALRTLLGEMLAHAAKARPTAAEVADRLDELVQGMSGPTYREWCRRFDFDGFEAGRAQAHGPLENREVSIEGQLVEVPVSAARDEVTLIRKAGKPPRSKGPMWSPSDKRAAPVLPPQPPPPPAQSPLVPMLLGMLIVVGLALVGLAILGLLLGVVAVAF